MSEMKHALRGKQVTVKTSGSETTLIGTCHDTDEIGIWLQMADNASPPGAPHSARPGHSLMLFVPFSQMVWLAVALNQSELLKPR